MKLRSFLFLSLLGVAGCSNATSAPVSTPVAPTQVEIQPLTADQLARIMSVNVWTATYSGGPIECWLEIEEEGQSTVARRIPEKGFLGDTIDNRPSEGTIEFWWTRREDRAGGMIQIQAGRGSYGYGFGKDALTFGWSSFSASSTTPGKQKILNGEPGKSFVIVDYDANESTKDDPTHKTRRVHMKLMGRFPEPSK